ncbi:MAG: hemin uptake protein HemP [Pseudomonadota bacterium]
MDDTKPQTSGTNEKTSNSMLEIGPSRTAVPSNVTPHYHTKDLFGVRLEIVIEHEGSAYRLIITRHGKLILNK